MPGYPYLEVANRTGAGVAAGFGLLLCLFSYSAISDIREHVESNWRKAGYVLEGTWQSDWTGRKSHGWLALLVIGWFAVVAFATLLFITLYGQRPNKSLQRGAAETNRLSPKVRECRSRLSGKR